MANRNMVLKSSEIAFLFGLIQEVEQHRSLLDCETYSGEGRASAGGALCSSRCTVLGTGHQSVMIPSRREERGEETADKRKTTYPMTT
jgi:hypothetical protein